MVCTSLDQLACLKVSLFCTKRKLELVCSTQVRCFQISSIGIEPTTFGFGGRGQQVPSDSLSEVASIADPQRTNERTSSPENDHGRAVQDSLPIKGDSFSAALAMIASLPLSDAEKADAVRRLMAEQFQKPGEV